MYWDMHSEMFSFSCPYADANAGASPKELFCCVFQEQLTIEPCLCGAQLLLQVEMSLQQ